MAFSGIARFVTEVKNRGTLRSAKFSVQFPAPNAISSAASNRILSPSITAQQLQTAYYDGSFTFYAEQASIPGAMLETQPVRRWGYGPVEMKPYAPRFNDLDIVFRADAKGLIHSFLHTWMRSAIEYDYPKTLNDKTGVDPGQRAFEVAYKTEYAVDLTLTCYSDDGQPSLVTVFREAYPYMIGDVQLHWESKEYVRIPVKFTYLTWFAENQPPINGVPIGP